MSRPDILLVDDEEDILDLGIYVLREAGYEAVPALSGDIAVILLEQGLPFQVLITDVVMPGLLDGFALARRARELRPEIRIIYSTGFSGVASVRSRGAPHGERLIKPWRPEDLVRIVSQCSPSLAEVGAAARLPPGPP